MPLLLQPDSHRAEIANYLSQRLGRPVAIGKLEFGIFPPALRMQGVSILLKADAPLLQADQVEAKLDIPSLFRAKVAPQAITLSRWQLMTRRRADGSWDLTEWLGGASKGALPDSWPIQSIALKQGEWHWTDSFGPTPQELVIRDLEGSLGRNPQSIHLNGTLTAVTPITLGFEGKGSFTGQASWSGDLRLADEGRAWMVHVNGQDAGLEASGQSSEWRVDNAWALARFFARWPGSTTADPQAFLRDWKTQLSVQASSTSFYQVATISGGLSELKGEVTKQGAANPRLHLKAALQNVPVDALQPVTEVSGLEGKVTGLITDLWVTLSTAPWSTVTGSGYAEVKSGRVRLPAATIKSLAKAHTMKYMQTKFPSFDQQGLPLDQAGAHWQATNGSIAIDDGLMAGPSYKAAIVGKVDVARKGVDAYLRLQFSETAANLKKLIPGKYLYGAPGHEMIQPIYGRLQGAWSEWTLRALPSSKIPSAVQNKLRRVVR